MWLLLACAPSSTGVLPITEGDGFFDRPFPSDSRVSSGHPDLEGFPHQGEVELLDAYLDVSHQVDGFGTSSPFWLRFSEAIDLTLLPQPGASLRADSPVFLVDVDRQSPHQGERIPLTFEWTEEQTAYQPGNLLAIAPVPGFALRGGTTYAMVFQEPLVAPTVHASDWREHPEAAAIEATLRSVGVEPEALSLVVPFTTQDPRAELADIAWSIHHELGLPAWDQELTLVEEHSGYRVFVGEVVLPIWQAGTRPYRQHGGNFVLDAEGHPQVQGWERVHFGLTIPSGSMPENGWPVVLYGHGTGGDYLTFTRSNSDEGPVMAQKKVAMIGVSQPLHADRATPDTDPELDSFNYLNPQAGRSNFRQGAADHIFLAHLLAARPPTFRHQGETIRLDPERMAWFGHSQGGITGAIATPFMSQDLVAAGFSGAGGVLALTLQLRKDPIDIQALIQSLLGFEEGEEANSFHPVVGLIQSMAEVTDPVNYASGWYAEDPQLEGRPLPVILTEGLLDEETPSVTSEALATAGHLPIVGVPATDPVGLRLRGLKVEESLPVENNQRDWEGEWVTAGLSQYPNNGHFAIYDNRKARTFYQTFLSSALNGEALLP